MITQEELKRHLVYDPETGLFTRIKGAGGEPIGVVAGDKDGYYGYIAICINYKTYRAHRLAFLYMTGKWPKFEVDHIDGDRKNNKWLNLRDISRAENACNCAIRSDNTSGIIGVGYHKKRKQWRARIKCQHIGWFATKEEAALAREQHPLFADFSERHGKEPSMFNNSF